MNIDKKSSAFELTKLDVKALAAFCGTGEPLGCVSFEPDFGYVIATDGKSLVLAELRGSFSGPDFLVPIKSLISEARLLTGKNTLGVRFDAKRRETVLSTVAGRGCSATFDEIKTSYPKWRQVVPGRDFGGQKSATNMLPKVLPDSSGFDAALVARLALVQKAAGAEGAKFSFYGTEKRAESLCAVFKGQKGEIFTVVVMGMVAL